MRCAEPAAMRPSTPPPLSHPSTAQRPPSSAHLPPLLIARR